MNDLIPIEVICHSGYKADEYPVYFYWENIRFSIKEITDRWYEKGLNPEFPATDYFKITTDNDTTYLLKHDLKKDQWFLWIQGESLNL